MTLLRFLELSVPVVAFLMMVAVGLDVTPAAAARATRRRNVLLLATAAQVVLLPLLAVAILSAVPASPRVAEYLLLMAACPGGGMSNVYVYLARANTPLSVVLTALSCMAAAVTMPAVLAIYSASGALTGGVQLPFRTLLAQLLAMTLVPVAAGGWIRFRWPNLEARYGGTLRTATAVGVILIVCAGLIQSRSELAGMAADGFVPALLLTTGGLALGWIIGRLAAMPAEDRFTLLIEFAVRNLAIAMVIEVSLLGHADFIAFGALALLVQAALLLAAVRIYRR